MWGLLALLIGVLYGWLTPGRQDPSQFLARGLIIGLIVGLVLALLGFAIGSNPVHVGTGVAGLVLGVVVISLVFVLGVWVGDLIERRPHRST